MEYAVYPAAKKRRLAGAAHPEEAIRLAAYNELIEKYGYPPHRIDIEFPVKIRDDEQPRYADIVVFDDDAFKRPLIVVECKRPNRKDGERQGQRYATILRAVYVLWTNGTARSSSVLVNRYPEEAEEIKDIPRFGGEPKYEIAELQPFDDDRELASIIRRCHDTIRSIDKKKPDAAFDEFLKFLFVKFQDERKDSEFEIQTFLRGVPPKPESINETAQRVRALFHHAAIADAEISSVFSEYDDIKLSNETLARLTKLVQRYSFTATSVDIKARAFETFLSGDLRQEFKEFMTPRGVVEAIVAMASPTASTYTLDPCCGTAAFLIYSLRYVRERLNSKRIIQAQKIRQMFDFAHDRLWGFDASPQMANIARLNMMVNEDGRAHIFQHDSLQLVQDAPASIQRRTFDLIMTNPPFGQRIEGRSTLLENFEISKLSSESSSHLSEVLFLERNLDWLKPGGRMFIVLPDSVLGNRRLGSARTFIEQRARLVGVVSLPPDTFGPSGAKSKTSFVILEKRYDLVEEVATDEEVFVADVKNIGYDFTGRKTTEESQLPQVVQCFDAWTLGKDFNSIICKSIKRSSLGVNWLASPHFARRESSRSREADREANEKKSRVRHEYWELGDICSEIGIGKTAARSEYTSAGVHILKVGNLTGRGIQWGCVERQFVSEAWANRMSRAQVNENDILFTAAAHGPKWIGLKVDIFQRVPPEFGTKAMFCAEIMRIHVDEEYEIDPLYVLLFLRSAAGYAEIQRCIRGQSGHIYRDEVAGVRLPKPSKIFKPTLEQALSDLRNMLQTQEDMHLLQRRTETMMSEMFPTSVQKPIIAR